MLTAAQPLLSLTAADLMSEAVFVIPEEMSLHAAAHLLSQAQVSGAPVVDRDGRCVGVLSAADFLAWADRGVATPGRGSSEAAHLRAAWMIAEPARLPEEQVANYMTADPVVVKAVTPLGELCRMMMDAGIRRVIVTDQEDRPVGIVSSTDVLAAVAHAAEVIRTSPGVLPSVGQGG